MKVLVVGGGGREHAIVWKIAQSALVTEVVAAPGNVGMRGIARTVPVASDDLNGLLKLARDERFDLTIVGPELPLTLGLVDRLEQEGHTVFGPSEAAARLEGSKWFAKELMLRSGVPTARAFLAETPDAALGRARELGFPVVLKADGLAAGKGVVIARDESEARATIEDAMSRGRFGLSGRRLVVEEFLEGEEASVLAIVDGERAALLASSQDHKRALDNDEGPNTGGMGAYAPAPVVTRALLEDALTKIVLPTVRSLRETDGTVYRGVLYAGLMMTSDGPKVLEYNCRFGDPETQVVLPLLDGDLFEIAASAARGELDPATVRTKPGAAACVVMASGGYPAAYQKGKVVRGVDHAAGMTGVVVFHAGTAERDGEIVTAGGRVLGVTGTADDLSTALGRAYEGVRAIEFEGAHYRTDIGRRALERIR